MTQTIKKKTKQSQRKKSYKLTQHWERWAERVNDKDFRGISRYCLGTTDRVLCPKLKSF